MPDENLAGSCCPSMPSNVERASPRLPWPVLPARSGEAWWTGGYRLCPKLGPIGGVILNGGYLLPKCCSFSKLLARAAAVLERRPAACYYPAIEGFPPGASVPCVSAAGKVFPVLQSSTRGANVITSENLQQRDVTFKPGDTVRVHYRVIEGNRERVQVFEGLCISRKGGGINETFTVRKNSFGVNVERVFPLQSPKIAKIEVASRGAVRRAKLYYIRDKVGKKARVKKAK